MRKAWPSFAKLAALAGGVLLVFAASGAGATQGSDNTYKYDSLGRLIQVIINNGGASVTTINYTYDAAGNRTQTTTTITSNNAPTAAGDTVTTAIGIPVTWDPRVNDGDSQGDYLTIATNTNPVNGTVVNNGTTFTYTPHSGFTGTDTFTYQVTDGHLNSTSATETVVVTAEPTTNPDSLVTTPNTAASLDPRVNDSFPSGLSLTVTGVTNGAHGATSVNSAGTVVTYTPANNFTGTDSFGYTVSDGANGTATGTVNVIVGAAPIAVNDSISTPVSTPFPFDPRTNDSDPAGYPPLSVNSATQGSLGTTTFNGTSITYTPGATAGSDSFTYTVKDAAGLVSAPATVNVTVTAGGNQPPVAVNDTMFAQATYTGGAGVQPQATIDPRTNDSSPENYPLTVNNVTQGSVGSVTFTGTTVTYTFGTAERRSFHGTDSFTYTVSDGHGGTSQPATVTVTIEVDTTQ